MRVTDEVRIKRRSVIELGAVRSDLNGSGSFPIGFVKRITAAQTMLTPDRKITSGLIRDGLRSSNDGTKARLKELVNLFAG